jgi:hypothetical protein
MGLVTIIYCLRFKTSLFVASYNSQGYGGGIRLPPPHGMTQSESESELYYDRRSVRQSVLVSSPHLGLMTRFLLLSDHCGFLYGASSLTRGRVCLLQCTMYNVQYTIYFTVSGLRPGTCIYDSIKCASAFYNSVRTEDRTLPLTVRAFVCFIRCHGKVCLSRKNRSVLSETGLPNPCPAMDYSGFQTFRHTRHRNGLTEPLPSNELFRLLGFPTHSLSRKRVYRTVAQQWTTSIPAF